MEFERLVSAQCESLIQMIHERREFLLDTIRMDKETKIRTLKVKQQNNSSSHQKKLVLINTNCSFILKTFLLCLCCFLGAAA